MEEYRRIFRYVIPGVIFVVELIIFIIITDPSLLSLYKKIAPSITDTDSNIKLSDYLTIGTVIIAFLATGAIGHILGSIYHCFFHILRYFNNFKIPRIGIDHLTTLNEAIKNKYVILTIRGCNCDITTNKEKITQSGAWRIVNSLWNEGKNTNKILRSAEPRARVMADILHSTGTNLIASLLAALLWLYLFNENWYHFYRTIGVITFLLAVHISNYLFVIKDYNGFINSAIIHALKNMKFSNSMQPTVILISNDDFKTKTHTC